MYVKSNSYECFLNEMEARAELSIAEAQMKSGFLRIAHDIFSNTEVIGLLTMCIPLFD